MSKIAIKQYPITDAPLSAFGTLKMSAHTAINNKQLVDAFTAAWENVSLNITHTLTQIH